MATASVKLVRVDATVPAVWARIVSMDARCFSTDDPALADNSGAWWIARCGDEDAGYCGVMRVPSGNAYLCRAGVLPKYRGAGLQKQMIRVRVAYARKQGWPLVVTDTNDNPASSNSLISCGFRLYRPASPWALPTSLYWRKNLA